MTMPESAKRVLIVSATVGAGHNQAAKAAAAAISSQCPGAQVRIVDVLDYAPWLFRLYYAGGFGLLMSRAGWVYGLGYWLFDRPHRPSRSTMERGRLLWERLNTSRFDKFLLDYKPDLIVNTHFLAIPIIGRMIEQGQITCPQAVVVTDVLVHRWWYGQNVDHWFLPQDNQLERLASWGIERQRITVSGIPILPKWAQPIDREKVLSDWHLPRDKKLLTLAAGAEFTAGPVVKVANGVLAARQDVAVICLAGKNKKLLVELASQPEAGKRLFPVAFTDRNHELVGVSSLIVTKPGGVTTAECLATGTPMVLLQAVAGQERNNALYFESQYAAVYTHGVDDVIQSVNRLLGDEGQLQHLAGNARRLHREGGPAIARYVSQVLQGRGE